ncbi:hypothetical protein N8941_00305 [Aquiluna sp.]|nr:hypothetical protein [Aquiluna sp.]
MKSTSRKKKYALYGVSAVVAFFLLGFLYPIVIPNEDDVGLGQPVSSFELVSTRNYAVVPLTFSDSSPSDLENFPSTEELQDSIFSKEGAVRSWLTTQSYGMFELRGTVFDAVSYPTPYIVDTATGQPMWLEEFVSVDLPERVNLEGFDAVIFVPLHQDALSTAVVFSTSGEREWDTFLINGSNVSGEIGLAWVPIRVGKDSSNNLINSFSERWVAWERYGQDEVSMGTWDSPLTHFQATFLHEMIHELGAVGHANTRTGDGVGHQLADPDSDWFKWEYGNHFDLMGLSPYSQGLSSFFAHRLGWTSDRVITVEAGESATVTLHPNDSPVGTVGVQMLNRGEYTTWPYLQDADFTETGYWIEVLPGERPFSSNLDFVLANAEGVIIHQTDGVAPFLLDPSPEALRQYEWGEIADVSDMVLRKGESFEDDRVRIEVLGINPDSSVEVRVSKTR